MFEQSMYPQLPANFCFPFSNAEHLKILFRPCRRKKAEPPSPKCIVFVLVMMNMNKFLSRGIEFYLEVVTSILKY